MLPALVAKKPSAVDPVEPAGADSSPAIAAPLARELLRARRPMTSRTSCVLCRLRASNRDRAVTPGAELRSRGFSTSPP